MIAIIDYGVGNLGSIANMFRKIGVKAEIVSDLPAIARATKLILPGVGAFDHGMHNLEQRGLIPLLRRKVDEERTPLLGLCLGLQLLARRSEEGSRPGLGFLEADVVRFDFPGDTPLKIPHMGWSGVAAQRDHALLRGFDDEMRFYFVHSYHLRCDNDQIVLGMTEYGYRFASVAVRDNVMGVQFHPEKSHRFGMRLLDNFAHHV